jgi:hypothetical protein
MRLRFIVLLNNQRAPPRQAAHIDRICLASSVLAFSAGESYSSVQMRAASWLHLLQDARTNFPRVEPRANIPSRARMNTEAESIQHPRSFSRASDSTGVGSDGEEVSFAQQLQRTRGRSAPGLTAAAGCACAIQQQHCLIGTRDSNGRSFSTRIKLSSCSLQKLKS